jgi:hypothetical protein
MGVGLAFKRVSRLFELRSWARVNLDRVLFYATGLFTGLYLEHHGRHSDAITYSAIATYVVLGVLRWSTREPKPPSNS